MACFINRESQQENMDAYLNQRQEFDSQFQQHEPNTFSENSKKDYHVQQEYSQQMTESGLPSEYFTNTQSYKQSDCNSHKVHCQSSQFESSQEKEYFLPYQVNNKNFRFSQENSNMSIETVNTKKISLPDRYLANQNDFKNYSPINSAEFIVDQQGVNNTTFTFEAMSNSRNLLDASANFSNSVVSNPNLTIGSSRTLEFGESQLFQMQSLPENVTHTIPQMHENLTSSKDNSLLSHPQPIKGRYIFPAQVSEENCISKSRFNFNSADLNSQCQDINESQNIFKAERHIDHLYNGNAIRNNFEFCDQYVSNKTFHSLNQKCLEDGMTNSIQQYEGNEMISAGGLEAFYGETAKHHGTGYFTSNLTVCNNQDFQKLRNFNPQNLASSSMFDQACTTYQVNNISLNLHKNMGSENNSGEIREEFRKTDHQVQNSMTKSTVSDEPNTNRSDFFSSYTTANEEFLPLTTSVSTYGENIANYFKTTDSDSNTFNGFQKKETQKNDNSIGSKSVNIMTESSQIYENLAQSNTSINFEGNKDSTALYFNDQRMFECSNHLTNSSRNESNFSENNNLQSIRNNITYEEASPNTNSFVDSLNINSYSSSQCLKIHPQTHSKEKPFACNICPRRFKRKSFFARHILTHTKNKPFQCNFCPERFNLKHHLNRHIQTHRNERSYKCSFCDKRFNVKYYLNIHIRTHTNERPYKCKLCNKRYKHKENLNYHIRTHTNERPHKCKYCTKSFIRRSCLNQHIQSHTNEHP